VIAAVLAATTGDVTKAGKAVVFYGLLGSILAYVLV